MPVVLVNPHLKMPTRTGPKTEMRKCRSWPMEFTRREGNGLNDTEISNPPWYVVRYRGGFWSRNTWHYVWHDYGGPPKVFLTRKNAEIEARSFRKQYRDKDYGRGRLQVEVAKIECPE